MVDGRTIAIAGAKGGVGKTTTCLNLGAEFAANGYATVVVELDLGMANLLDFLDIDLDPTNGTTFHDVLAGDASVDEALHESIHGMQVLPSGTSLDGYAETDLSRLPGVTSALREEYDFVLFDTPAGVSEETVEPIRLADEMVLVSTPRVSSVRNADNTHDLAERMNVETRGLVVTKSGTGASPGAETIADFLGIELLGHVPEEESIPYSQDKGLPVVANAPESDAARAYREIARELAPGEFVFPPSMADTDERERALAGRVRRPTQGPEFRTPPRRSRNRVGGDDEHRHPADAPEAERSDRATTTAVDPSGSDPTNTAEAETQRESAADAEATDEPPADQDTEESSSLRDRVLAYLTG